MTIAKQQAHVNFMVVRFEVCAPMPAMHFRVICLLQSLIPLRAPLSVLSGNRWR